VDGPDLRVAPPMALSLSMALHELCTNAVKYGALGAPEGEVHISWSTLKSASGLRLVMRWEERGGPIVVAPARKGFGSRLIQEGLARELNGEVRLIYEPSGVVCTVDVPLS
jgi:two-component sensor histidine kinase